MATSAFRLYNKAKKYLLIGGLDLDATTVRIALGRAASISNYALTNWAASVNKAGFKVSGGGYAMKTATSITVTQQGSAKVMKWSIANLTWTATGSNIKSIKYLMIGVSNGASGKALGWIHLTDTAFNLATPNTLTIQWSASGVFTLSGGVT